MRDAPGDPVGEGHADAGKDRSVLAFEDRVRAHIQFALAALN